VFNGYTKKVPLMVSLEFRDSHELFDKVETGLKVKFDFSFYKILYKKGDIIPIDKAVVIDHDGGVAYSLYDDPEAIVYTVRIDHEDNDSIMLNGFWQKKDN